MADGIARLVGEWDALVSSLQVPSGANDPVPADQRVPVTVIGGFLGSGKTTLLRHLLEAQHGLRLAVVVNDLGEVNIDSALVTNTDAERIELSNGCTCCTLGPDLARSLHELASRAEAPDAIVIEASGVGDPSGIATVIGGEPVLRLDGIVTVVDAPSIAARLAEPALGPLVRRQLDAAHLVVLAKPDLVADRERSAVVDLLGEVAPGRPVILVEHGRLDPAIVLSAAARGARPDPGPGAPPETPFRTRVVPVPRATTRADLVTMIEGLDGVIRAKGFVELAEAPGRAHLVQVVGRAWTIEEWGPLDVEVPMGQLVTIS